MKQPKDQEQRKDDKEKPNQGIDPKPEEPPVEADLNDQDPGERQKRNQGSEKDDPLAA
jgi:hypothetical protein